MNIIIVNSSSSSFIVAFPKVPATVEELQSMLFDKDQAKYPAPDEEGDYWDRFPVRDVAETVFSDMHDGPMEEGDLLDAFKNSYFSSDEFIHNDHGLSLSKSLEERYAWLRKQNDLALEYGAAELKRFKDHNDGSVFYRFEYGDNCGEMECVMEHGNLFRKLRHVQISHH